MIRQLPIETYKAARGEWDAIIKDLRDRKITVYLDPISELVLIEFDEHELNNLWSITHEKVVALPAPPEYKL